MADPKTSQAPADAEPEGPLYPAIENFIEKASADQVGSLFEPIKDGLTGLKGPKAEQAKKVQKAIAAIEELLQHLLEVRERLDEDRKKSRRGRK